jgi:NAD(P)-dependent dehydrogenase (short-subunit alcohol dehydrogenase family)
MGKVSLVTGSGRGLGYCTTERLLKKGHRVYALEYNITDELRSLEKQYPALHVSQCDVGNCDSVKKAVEPLLGAEKRLDYIFSIAGIFSWDGEVGLAETSIDMCMNDYNVNALGSLRLCKEAWPLIQKGTLVVIVSSEAGSIGATRRKFSYAYCMSKCAVNMLGKILSNELWDIGARVMLFDPGFMRTVMGGEKAQRTETSVEPSESAENIINIAETVDTIPRDQMYMTHKGIIIPW